MYEFTEDCLIPIDQLDEEHRRLFQFSPPARKSANTYASTTSRSINPFTSNV